MFLDNNRPDQNLLAKRVGADAVNMSQPLKVLMVEDSALDCELIVQGLWNAGFALEWRRVETEADYLAALQPAPDLVLSDFQMPRFNGLRALELLKERGPDIPFILISGTIGEDTAVAAMLQGASDYLLKDRLARLGAAVSRALADGRLRRERRRLEQAQVENAELIRDVLNSLTSAVVVLDEFGDITATNERWRRVSRENGGGDLDNVNYLAACAASAQMFGQADAQAAADGIRSVLDGVVAEFSMEYPCHSPDERRWFLMRVSPLGGAKRGVVVAHEKITERKLAEEALQRQQTELRVLFDYLPAMICFKDTQNGVLRANQRLAAMIGKTVADVEGKPSSELFPEDAAKFYEDDLKVIRSGAPCLGIVETVRDAAGRDVSIQTDKVPVFDRDGKVSGIIVMAQDITEREHASALLQASQQRLALATKAARIGIWDWDVRADRMVWDERMRQLYGLCPEDLIDTVDVWKTRLHPEDKAGAEAEIAEALAGTQDFNTEFRVVWPGGEVRDIEAHALVVRAADGSAERMIGVNWDITDRRRAAKNLRDSEERFRHLIENVSDVIVVVDDAGVITFQSPSAQRVLGYAADEITGHRFAELIHPDDQEKARQGLQRAFVGLPVEYRIRHCDGTWRIFQSNGRAMADATGAGQVVVNSRGITEVRQLEEQFLRAQRLEAVGTLSSGIAHDLNNILAPILIIAPLLKEKRSDPHDNEMLTIVERSAQRGADIIKQLLTFSRGVDGERGPMQARHLLAEMLVLMRETFPREITILQQIAPDLSPVNADTTQIHQVLMNLCVNARDAMPAGGNLTVAAKNVAVSETEAARDPLAAPGPYVCIGISDTGAGIPRENLVRIFEPFFTTKEVGKGTGLGLSTVRGIVKSHGGFVTVTSEPGRGTSFNVFLPAITEAQAAKPTDAAIQPTGGRELILVVDDELSIRRALSLALEQGGYRVLVAADGREAMSLFLLDRQNIRLVLTDLMMPGMNGMALIRNLRALDPHLGIVAASGLHDQDRRAELAALGVKSILAKPCSVRDILNAVQHELSSVRIAP